jgi:hypothetical protein
MYIQKKVIQKVLHYVLACDECKKTIRTNAIFIALRKAEKGLNDRRVWVTKKKAHYHPNCFIWHMKSIKGVTI